MVFLHNYDYYETSLPIIGMLKKLQTKPCFSKIAKIEIENDISALKKDTENFKTNNILDRIIDQLQIIYREKNLGAYPEGTTNQEKIKSIKQNILESNSFPEVLVNYMKYVTNLEFEETPNYNLIINSFKRELEILAKSS